MITITIMVFYIYLLSLTFALPGFFNCCFRPLVNEPSFIEPPQPPLIEQQPKINIYNRPPYPYPESQSLRKFGFERKHSENEQYMGLSHFLSHIPNPALREALILVEYRPSSLILTQNWIIKRNMPITLYMFEKGSHHNEEGEAWVYDLFIYPQLLKDENGLFTICLFDYIETEKGIIPTSGSCYHHENVAIKKEKYNGDVLKYYVPFEKVDDNIRLEKYLRTKDGEYYQKMGEEILEKSRAKHTGVSHPYKSQSAINRPDISQSGASQSGNMKQTQLEEEFENRFPLYRGPTYFELSQNPNFSPYDSEVKEVLRKEREYDLNKENAKKRFISYFMNGNVSEKDGRAWKDAFFCEISDTE